MNGRWTGTAAALALAACMGAAPAAWAQVGVSMGNSAARPLSPAVPAEDALPGNTPAVPAAARGRSEISRPSQAGQLPEPAVTTRDTRPPTSLMGMSPANAPSATTSVDFGAVLNTGSRIQRDNASKICPPGTMNRNNFCVPPATGVLAR